MKKKEVFFASSTHRRRDSSLHKSTDHAINRTSKDVWPFDLSVLVAVS